MRMMNTATNTLSQLQKQMDIVSHNIANLDTTGYKRKEANFTDLLVQQLNNQTNPTVEGNRLTPMGIRVGAGAKIAQSQIVMSQGSIKTTDRRLDVAFTAENQYFKVLEQTDDGTAVRYTRDGAFYLTPVSPNENMLVTGDGYPVLDENNNPITINGQADDYTISDKGSMVVSLTNGGTQTFNLGVVRINKPQFLEQIGGNLLGLPDNIAVQEADIFTQLTGVDRNQISMQQGALEQSNVDLSKEMSELINIQRSYQFQSRAISTADQMMGLVNGIR